MKVKDFVLHLNGVMPSFRASAPRLQRLAANAIPRFGFAFEHQHAHAARSQ